MDRIVSVLKMHQFSSAIKNHCSNLFAGVHLKTNMYIIFNILLMKSNRCLVKIRCRPSAKQIFPVIGLSCCQLLWPQGGPLCFLWGILNKVEERFSAYFHQPSRQMWKSITSLFINICVYRIIAIVHCKKHQELSEIEGVHLWNLGFIPASALWKFACWRTEPLIYLCTQIRLALSVSHLWNTTKQHNMIHEVMNFFLFVL